MNTNETLGLPSEDAGDDRLFEVAQQLADLDVVTACLDTAINSGRSREVAFLHVERNTHAQPFYKQGQVWAGQRG